MRRRPFDGNSFSWRPTDSLRRVSDSWLCHPASISSYQSTGCFTYSELVWLVVFRHLLPTPLKNHGLLKSVGLMIHSQYDWKVIKFHGSKQPTSCVWPLSINVLGLPMLVPWPFSLPVFLHQDHRLRDRSGKHDNRKSPVLKRRNIKRLNSTLW